jgi:hypothetical protein
MFKKLSIFLYKLPSATSFLSLPHSQENTQPFGACSGIGGTGFLTKGKRLVSFNQAPWPEQAEKIWFRKGAYMTPMVGRESRIKAMETQNMGKRWV